MEILTYLNIHHTLVCSGERGGVLCDTSKSDRCGQIRLGQFRLGWGRTICTVGKNTHIFNLLDESFKAFSWNHLKLFSHCSFEYK